MQIFLGDNPRMLCVWVVRSAPKMGTGLPEKRRDEADGSGRLL